MVVPITFSVSCTLPRFNARGISLLELLVAVAIGFVLLLLATDWLTRGGKLAQLLSTRCALQQEALVVCNKIAADLARTSSAGLSLKASAGPSDPAVAAIHRLSSSAYGGSPYRESQLQVYYWRPADTTLWHKTYPPSNPDLAIQVTSNGWCSCPLPTLLALAGQPNGSEGKVCSRVSAFSLSLDQAGVATLQVRLQEPSLDPKARAHCEASRSLYLRNHF